MPRLMRVHFASIGHRDARLAPLTLDLRAGGGGSGVDSVLWLRNGGGKSSILNLFFSVLRPRLRDFLGATAEGKSRRLDDYVRGTDLAAVVTEWDLLPRLGDLPRTPEKTYLIGQVLSWKGGQRSSDQTRLRRLYFGLRSGPGVALDDLPIQGLATPLRSFEELRDWLTSHKRSRPELEVTCTEKKQAWEKHLISLGIDPELMRVQIAMNVREGAADELFRFTSPRAFIDFFLELAMDFTVAHQVSTTLDTFRVSLQQRPVLLRRRELFDTVLPALERLAAAALEREEAHAAAARTLDLAARTSAALSARTASFASRLAARQADAEAATEAARLASNDADARRRWAGGLERRAAHLAHEEAKQAHAIALRGREQADRRLRTVTAAITLDGLRGLEAQRQAKQEALDRENAELAPIKRDLDLAGARLRAVLRRREATLAEAATEARAQEEAARDEEVRIDRERLQLTAAKAATEAEIRTLKGKLAARDSARTALTRDSIIDGYEDALGSESRWRARLNAAEAHRDQALADQRSLEEDRVQANEGLTGLREERSAATVEERALTATLRQAQGWRERLRQDPVLCGLQGVDEADLDQPRLVALTREQADLARRQHLAQSVDAAEDRRALEALESEGLLPPTRDVDELLRALQGRQVVAHSGIRHLVDNYPAAEVQAQLVADPQRHTGVVVMRAGDLEIVRSLDPAALRLRAPLQISAVDRSKPPPTAEGVILPDPALYDRSAADQRLRALTEAEAQRTSELTALQGREAAHRSSADELGRFLEAWGRGKLDQKEAVARELAARIARLGDEVAHSEERLRELRELLERALQAQRAAEAEIAGIQRALQRLADFIETHERHVDGWRSELDTQRRRENELSQHLEGADAALETAKEAVRRAHDRLRDLQRDSAELRQVIDAIAYARPEGDDPEGDDPTLSEAAARATYTQLREIYEKRTSESRLRWELDQLQEQVQGRRAALDAQVAGGLDRRELESICNAGELAEAKAAAEAAVETTRGAVARAEHALEVAARTLRELKRRREADDLPPDQPTPATSEAAREAAARYRDEATDCDAVASEHRQRAEAATRGADALERRLERLRSEHDRLRELAGELPERPAAVLPEEDSVLARDLERLRTDLRDTRGRAAEAVARTRAAAEEVRHLASDERFTGLRSQARDRLRGDLAELEARAADLAEELVKTREVLQTELDELDEHRRILLGNLVALGESAVLLLKQASRASTLPGDLGAWSGRPYLKVDLKIPEAEADKRARLEPLIDRLMDNATIPSAVKLVQETVFALAGGRDDASRVTVLKPDAILRYDPVPIEQLSTFSRGQQLTASILLYCTIVQLRARQRGRGGRLSDAGVLILDNPIGTCSNRALLDLQRMIAQRMGVQLVYTTGVEDADAIAVLPNTIRLRNAHRDRRSGDLHVTQGGDEPERSLAVARIEARGS